MAVPRPTIWLWARARRRWRGPCAGMSWMGSKSNTRGNDHGPAKTPYVYDILSLNANGKGIKVFATGIRQPWQMVFPAGSSSPYVSDLGQRLAKDSERPHLPYTFRVLDDASVSRKHALLHVRRVEGGVELEVEDLGSTNGTLLGGARLVPRARWLSRDAGLAVLRDRRPWVGA